MILAGTCFSMFRSLVALGASEKRVFKWPLWVKNMHTGVFELLDLGRDVVSNDDLSGKGSTAARCTGERALAPEVGMKVGQVS